MEFVVILRNFANLVHFLWNFANLVLFSSMWDSLEKNESV